MPLQCCPPSTLTSRLLLVRNHGKPRRRKNGRRGDASPDTAVRKPRRQQHGRCGDTVPAADIRKPRRQRHARRGDAAPDTAAPPRAAAAPAGCLAVAGHARVIEPIRRRRPAPAAAPPAAAAAPEPTRHAQPEPREPGEQGQVNTPRHVIYHIVHLCSPRILVGCQINVNTTCRAGRT